MDLEVSRGPLLQLKISLCTIYETTIYIEFHIKWSWRSFTAVCPRASKMLMVSTQGKVFGSKKAIYQKIIYISHQLSGCYDISFSRVCESVYQQRLKWDRVRRGEPGSRFYPPEYAHWCCASILTDVASLNTFFICVQTPVILSLFRASQSKTVRENMWIMPDSVERVGRKPMIEVVKVVQGLFFKGRDYNSG